jgi:hypothetical protein
MNEGWVERLAVGGETHLHPAPAPLLGRMSQDAPSTQGDGTQGYQDGFGSTSKLNNP